MKKRVNLFLGLLIAVLFCIWLIVDLPLASPLGETPFSRFLPGFPHTKTKKIVYGFLPYWNMSSVTIQPELTHLAYFSLTIDEDGSFVTEQNGNNDLGYRRLQSEQFLQITSQASSYKARIDIVLSQLDNETIETFLADPEAQQTFLQSLDALLLAYPFNGVNLDIEYAGTASSELRGQFTDFVRTVSEHLANTYEDIQLSVDMYAAAASKNMLWEVEEVAPLVDYIIVMAYDFHRSSSPTAGPVAPLFQKEEGWEESITDYLQNFVRQVPTEKLLLGIPFYGYEWQTTSLQPESFTFPQTGATASYKRVKELLERSEQSGLTEHWDEAALAPYLSYTRDGKNYLVYYENPESITYKLEYVNQLDLAGIAIWSLGYEGDSRDLWNSIDQALEIEN